MQKSKCKIKEALFISCFMLLSSSAIAVESVCIDCHQDIAKKWKTSIHAENGISCHNCHGGNPLDADNAMDPNKGFVGAPKEALIPDFCGKCHVGVKENYLASSHGRALGLGGPSCVTCHSAHEQKRASLELISEELCGHCHSFERAEKIRNSMLMSETQITNLEKRIGALHVEGYDMDTLKKLLFATRNKFHRLTHVVDVNLILKETTGIQSEITQLESEISVNETTEVERKIFGSIFILFLLVGALVFWLYRHTVLKD